MVDLAAGTATTVVLDKLYETRAAGAALRVPLLPTDINFISGFGYIFEGNTRGISGGVGALVTKVSAPIANGDRINTAAEIPPQQGLQGSRTHSSTCSSCGKTW